jgi:predicted glycoside hydrolase/deacetylase ChbG (UPF0249 family)
MAKLQLVITADCLGANAERDQAIFSAYSAKAISQGSLWVGGANAKAAADASRRTGMPMGLHLDFTELPPSAPRNAVDSLVDKSGNKLGHSGLNDAISKGRIKPEHLKREAEAQLLAYAMLMGRPPVHFDSHHHAHCIPQIAEVLAPLFARAGVQSTRIPEGADEARSIYSAQGLRSSQSCLTLDLSDSAKASDHWRDAVLSKASEASIELCQLGCATERGDDALRILFVQPFATLIEDGAVEISSFEQLPRAGALR